MGNSISRDSDFNPRSYKRSDAMFAERAQEDAISIHAPTRGATGDILKSTVQINDFNPRSYKRSDHCVQFVPSKIWDISIHAPTRGATFVFIQL